MLEVTEEGRRWRQSGRWKSPIMCIVENHLWTTALEQLLDRANLLSVQHHLRPSSGRPPSYFGAEGELDFRFAAFSLISDRNRTFLLRLRALHRFCVSREFSVV